MGALFTSDAVKQALTAVSLCAGLLAAHMPDGAVRTVAATIFAIVSSLGIVSGGTSGSQPAKAARAEHPAVTTTATPPPHGFVDRRLLRMLLAIAIGLAGAVAACKTLQGASGTATVTTASGAQVTVSAGNGTECVSDTHWLALPGTNLECDSVCASEVPGATTITVPCRAQGDPATTILLQFPIPIGGSDGGALWMKPRHAM